jgi:hypothetical protein
MSVAPVLMSSDLDLVRTLAAAPADAHPAAVTVDWERPERRGTVTHGEPTVAQVDALVGVRAASPWPVICRINEVGRGTSREIERAIELGADEVLVPMVRSEAEVDRVQQLAAGRVGVGVMIETREAVARSASFARLGLSRAFVGLLDLAVERGTPSVFTALADGTVERVVADLGPTAYGFGGLTDPTRGHPVPARLLMGEIVRAGCSFAMMRNAFVADAVLSSPDAVLTAIRRELSRLAARSEHSVLADRRALLAVLDGLEQPAALR